MASENYAEVGTCRDADGDEIEIGTVGGQVRVEFRDSHPLAGGGLAAMLLGPGEREQFQRLFMEAERQAERYMCATPDDCVNGPDSHTFIPDNDDTLPCCRQPWEAERQAGADVPQ